MRFFFSALFFLSPSISPSRFFSLAALQFTDDGCQRDPVARKQSKSNKSKSTLPCTISCSDTISLGPLRLDNGRKSVYLEEQRQQHPQQNTAGTRTDFTRLPLNTQGQQTGPAEHKKRVIRSVPISPARLLQRSAGNGTDNCTKHLEMKNQKKNLKEESNSPDFGLHSKNIEDERMTESPSKTEGRS